MCTNKSIFLYDLHTDSFKIQDRCSYRTSLESNLPWTFLISKFHFIFADHLLPFHPQNLSKIKGKMLQGFHDHHGGDHGWPIAFGYWCQYYDTKHVLSRPEAAKALKATKLNYSSLEWRILQWFQCIGLALSYLKGPRNSLCVCATSEKKHFITVSASVNTVAKNSHSILSFAKTSCRF